ncbi:LysR family transcriptional regulator [Paenibacillus sp. GD4]|uniref:LysR family transcriptional regulator n=1 Tax=Paenibacillus sp. GD4 TaxID=3068890 RepID=UPI0027966769|nr:LysR family transcriptional regulator [Paenibacillus sp. GD4]
MDLTYLQTFREVAKWGSFTKAAEELGYAQSSVTAQIQKIEKVYGAALFERFGRKMRLTHAGEELLRYTHQMLRLYDESKEVVSSQMSGNIVIGTIETMAAFFLPPLLQQFRSSHPHVNVILQQGREAHIIEAVREGEYDFGLVLDLPFSDPELDTLAIREEPLVFIASPEHPLHQGCKSRGIQALDGHSLIVTELGCTYRAMLERGLKEQQVAYQLAYELGSIEAIKQCLIYGLGVGLLPRIAVNSEIEQGKLIALPIQLPGPPFYTQLITHKKKWMSSLLNDFIELLRDKPAGRTL